MQNNCKRKLIFSGHETFPLRYGWLKKVYERLIIEKQSNLKKDPLTQIFNDPESISSFGVGKNMVASMRYWAIHSDLIENHKLSQLGETFFDDKGLDPYMEDMTTIWLIHYNIVKKEELFTYYWFFNHYNGGSFDRQTLNKEIIEVINKDENQKLPSPTTLKRDIECFLRNYVERDRANEEYTDNSIEAPLAELNLINTIDNRTFTPNRGEKNNLSLTVVLFVLLDFWLEFYKSQSFLSFETLMYEASSPGRVFLLDENSMYSIINELSKKYSKILSWSETAGMKQFSLQSGYTLKGAKKEVFKQLKKEYK